ncbi:MAG TPA: 2-dehydropantoate 2-reductase N-terminal domain-containing protein [Myxococcota bacterium]
MNTSPLRIAVFGAGAIGTAFAFQLAHAGHAVTVVARGARLAQLRRDDGIVTRDGRRAAVVVADGLDEDVAYDLLLVTVLAPQVAAVLPQFVASRAKRVMFMFNTFEPVAPLRDAVGADRFTFGFPGGVFSLIKDGRIDHVVRSGTTVVDDEHAALFSAAGIPTVTTPDMHAWLRSHAALVVGMMSLGVRVSTRGSGATRAEARDAAVATKQAFALVRRLGHPLLPSAIAVLATLPTSLLTFTLWALSRTKILIDLGALGPHEPRMLIDQMLAASSSSSLSSSVAALARIRP